MRMIYIDEAGTSGADHEKVMVVVGVIVDADKHWRRLEEYRNKVISEFIPEEVREKFIFHAKDISAGNGKIFSDKDSWPPDRRWNFIERMLGSMVEIGISVAIGYYVTRDDDPNVGPRVATIKHAMCFLECLSACEEILGESDEVAIVVCENTDTMRTKLRELQADMQNPNSDLIKLGIHSPLHHIVDAPHFAEKDQAALLQIADAIAFCHRRYWSGFRDSERFIKAFWPADPPRLPAGRCGRYCYVHRSSGGIVPSRNGSTTA